jgi:hypothetical protein
MAGYDIGCHQRIGQERSFMREAGCGKADGYVRLRIPKDEMIRNIGRLKRTVIKDKTIMRRKAVEGKMIRKPKFNP